MWRPPPPIQDQENRHRKSRRKDTKRWCRGKEGREHRWKEKLHMSFGNHRYYTHRCTVCGKLDWSTYRYERVP